MKKQLAFVALLMLVGCQQDAINSTPVIDCSIEGLKKIDQVVVTGDGQGHGPDIGSAEWYSVIEHRLKIKNDPVVPEMQTTEWCEYIFKNYVADKLAGSHK